MTPIFTRAALIGLALLAADSIAVSIHTQGNLGPPIAADSGSAPCPPKDPACAPPKLTREFRGVWIASVHNIDWPSRPGLPPDVARLELQRLFDQARASGLNAVILQVRPAGDALYASDLEPWSEYLTGQQGVAPQPWWDPLKYAIEQARARGLELHAWLNPYRARHSASTNPLAPQHIAVAQPALVRTYGSQLWMDPGDPAARAHTIRVILDVVRRYDIDGIHIDDYFYPYKERGQNGLPIDFPDATSYARYIRGGGTLARDDWRRDNINALVVELYRSIHAVKPWVKFGVSPFGIWRPGHPASVVGFDAYNELYADARKWLREGSLDYISPQLYWPVAQPGQEYPVLLRWWAEQNTLARHLWPGNYASKVGESWDASEIEHQIRLTRAEAGASGNVHFSARAFVDDRDALATRLAQHLYGAPALVPPSPWLNVTPQGAPQLALERAGDNVTLKLAPTGPESPHWWLIQTRLPNGSWDSRLLAGSLRVVALPAAADRVAVRALDRASVEGPIRALQLR